MLFTVTVMYKSHKINKIASQPNTYYKVNGTCHVTGLVDHRSEGSIPQNHVKLIGLHLQPSSGQSKYTIFTPTTEQIV